jgi:hypothetical protein
MQATAQKPGCNSSRHAKPLTHVIAGAIVKTGRRSAKDGTKWVIEIAP